MIFFNKIKQFFLFVFLIALPLCATGQSSKFIVTLDAGHGGHDAGAKYDGHVEKDVALAIVLKVGKILESNPKIDVIYTRKTDVFIDLIERAEIANRADANIFVSIHCNANVKREAYGTETYVMGMTKIASNLAAAKKENAVVTLEKDYKQKYAGFDYNSPETMIGMTLMQEEYLENSIYLASKVQKSFAAMGKKIRGAEDGDGVKQAPYMVLHKAYMPRVLIETGFISNPIEGSILASEEGQNEIAKGIAEAIGSYKREFFDSEESGTVDEKPATKVIELPVIEKQLPIKQPAKVVEKQKRDSTVAVKLKSVSNSKTLEMSPSLVIPISTSDTSGVLFKVQLMVSNKLLDLTVKNFKGLNQVFVEQENKMYKYYHGQTSNYEQAKNNLKESKSKGYASAFLVASKNGKKISITEALK